MTKEPDPTGGQIPPAAGTEAVVARHRPAWPFVKAACVAAALVYPVAWLLSRDAWVADLVCHLQEPALGATLLALGVAAVGNRRLALALALLAALELIPLVRYSLPNPVRPDPGSSARLRVLMANVLWDNFMFDDLAELIRRERPDVVGLVEYTPTMMWGLADVRREYSYRLEAPAGASGLALWFRKPPLSLDPPQRLGREGWPSLHATFAFAGRTCHLWLVHPRSPLKRDRRHAGNPELAALGERARNAGDSRIIIGDLNSTDGSAHFRDLLRVTGLRDSRLGFGRQPSWPTMGYYRIAIDHALVSDDLAVVDRRLGPKVGSDHFPLILDLAPAAPPHAGVASAETSPAAEPYQAAGSR
jgi:endonuclease/exonuclease/phosphatase (EEP) superfamily protein YafD